MLEVNDYKEVVNHYRFGNKGCAVMGDGCVFNGDDATWAAIGKDTQGKKFVTKNLRFCNLCERDEHANTTVICLPCFMEQHAKEMAASVKNGSTHLRPMRPRRSHQKS